VTPWSVAENRWRRRPCIARLTTAIDLWRAADTAMVNMRIMPRTDTITVGMRTTPRTDTLR